ncbi:hypothetical protein [Roseobacter sp.]|uniref:hypothetical protein n=1 Tax=Roseobacter sp. TaxID=1907202 RepID=UPI002966AED9|nr:hypothetical protein [Roseobacter sp.]MDW3181473.1 hypothetical protein [Roseobacter sp.]
MIRGVAVILVKLFFVLIFLALSASMSCADPVKTWLDGPILFRDEAGNEIAVPFKVSVIDEILQGRTLDFETGDEKFPVDVEVGSPPDSEFVKYEVRLGSSFSPPMHLQLDFNFDGFDYQERISIPHHLGEKKFSLFIQRRFPNRESRRQALRYKMGGTLTEASVSENLRLIEGLINDPISEGDQDTTDRLDDFNWGVKLMKAAINTDTVVSPNIALRVMTLPNAKSFGVLQPNDKFQIMADFAYWFARSPQPDQHIQSTLTYAGLARTFFEDAYLFAEEAEDTDMSDRKVSTTPLIRSLQERYTFECRKMKGTEGWVERCLDALLSAGEFDRKFSADSYQAILSEFSTVLFPASTPKPRHKTECEYRARVAVEASSEILFYWEDYIIISEIAGENQPRIKRRLERPADFQRKLDIGKNLERAKDIVALSDWAGTDFADDEWDKDSFSRTCSSEFPSIKRRMEEN